MANNFDSYGEYLSREEHNELMAYYRNNRIRRFHSMNAGSKVELVELTTFYSYYTPIFTISKPINDKYCLWPNMEYFKFHQSKATNRQLTRFLCEYTDYFMTINDIRNYILGNYDVTSPFIIPGTINAHDKYKRLHEYKRNAGFVYDYVCKNLDSGEMVSLDYASEHTFPAVFYLEEINHD